jgi:hypothetical protein
VEDDIRDEDGEDDPQNRGRMNGDKDGNTDYKHSGRGHYNRVEPMVEEELDDDRAWKWGKNRKPRRRG